MTTQEKSWATTGAMTAGLSPPGGKFETAAAELQ